MQLARRLGGSDVYRCDRCAAQPLLYQLLGHDAPPTGFWTHHLLTGEPLARCPVRTLQLAAREDVEELDRYLTLYWPAYEKGHLLTAGGIGDQPARFLEFLAAIEATRERIDARWLELRPIDDDA